MGNQPQSKTTGTTTATPPVRRFGYATIGDYHPFGKGRVLSVEETATHITTTYADADGVVTAEHAEWKLEAYHEKDGVYYHPTTPLALIKAIGHHIGRRVVVVQDGYFEPQVGTLRITCGPIKRPMVVVHGECGGDLISEKSMVSLTLANGQVLWERSAEKN